MTLKANWEKTDTEITLSAKTIQKMLQIAAPDLNLASYQKISGGCANLNIKLSFQKHSPLILRIYLRDKKAAIKEQELSKLCKNLPLAKTIYIGDLDKYTYALIEYIEGKTLREIILNEPSENIDNALYEAGAFIAQFQEYQFSSSGFFDSDLQIIEKLNKDQYLDFLNQCLDNYIITEQLGATLTQNIKKYVANYASCLHDLPGRSLVHADYDPSNILVHKYNGKWQITAILDWEFAFSGSYLCDVANMLRYAHQLPKSYEEAFLKGMHDAGIKLPPNWRTIINLLNLLSLLDCLIRANKKNRPNQRRDIIQLITNILD